MIKTKNFTVYRPIPGLVISSDRPYQVITSSGILVGYFASEVRADAYATALQEAQDAGTLPINISKWDKLKEHEEQFVVRKQGEMVWGPGTYQECRGYLFSEVQAKDTRVLGCTYDEIRKWYGYSVEAVE